MVSAQAEAGESKAGSRSAALVGAQSEAPGARACGRCVVPVAGECGEERRGGVGVAGGGGVVAEQASDVGGRVSGEDELRREGGGNWTAVLRRARSSTTRPFIRSRPRQSPRSPPSPRPPPNRSATAPTSWPYPSGLGLRGERLDTPGPAHRCRPHPARHRPHPALRRPHPDARRPLPDTALRVLADHNRVTPLESMGPQPCAGVYTQVPRPGLIKLGDLVC